MQHPSQLANPLNSLGEFFLSIPSHLLPMPLMSVKFSAVVLKSRNPWSFYRPASALFQYTKFQLYTDLVPEIKLYKTKICDRYQEKFFFIQWRVIIQIDDKRRPNDSLVFSLNICITSVSVLNKGNEVVGSLDKETISKFIYN